MLALIQTQLMRAAETGRCPDSLIRAVIRHLLRRRTRSLQTLDSSGSQEHLRRFMAECSAGPVAVVPDRANEQHYEVSPDFFQTVLGPRLKYSCCHWPEGVLTLADAETAALDVTCERADLRDGQSILELGCGWGSLSLWMAERYPHASIVAVSNSQLQGEFIRACADERGLTNLRVVTADINSFSPSDQFDRVVSVEMFEHVRNHAEVLRRIARWLNPGGRLFVHIFCHRNQPYLFEDQGPQDWMAREFFAGGMMPCESLLARYADDLALVRQWRWNGRHYARTCRAWLDNVDRNRPAALRALNTPTTGDDPARRLGRWRMFFMACEELFAFNGGEEWYVTHALFSPTSSPQSAATQRQTACHV